MAKNNVAFLIVAAGKSKRMGFPKQLLPWKNTTLLGNTIMQVLHTGAFEVFVVLGASYQRIKNSIEHLPVVIYRHKNWPQGMASSISFGIKHILEAQQPYHSVLITLSDLPLIGTPHYTRLIHRFNSSEKEIVATDFKGTTGAPVIFSRNYFNQLLPIKGDKGAKSILKKYSKDCGIVPTDTPYFDIDTPEAYQHLLEKYGHDHKP